MNGMIITARIRPAVRTPMPIMGPENSLPMTGRWPSVALSTGWT
jgi:hypothetical protein